MASQKQGHTKQTTAATGGAGRRSPGHQKWPEHKVEERHVDRRMRVEIEGVVLAESEDVIEVDEDGMPPRFYFPRSDVRMDALERTETTTECPFKGKARYFSVAAGDKRLTDAVWSYEEPYVEHADLKDRVAFYDDKLPEIHVTAMP